MSIRLPSTHPSTVPAYPHLGGRGLLEPSPADKGQKALDILVFSTSFPLLQDTFAIQCIHIFTPKSWILNTVDTSSGYSQQPSWWTGAKGAANISF